MTRMRVLVLALLLSAVSPESLVDTGAKLKALWAQAQAWSETADGFEVLTAEMGSCTVREVEGDDFVDAFKAAREANEPLVWRRAAVPLTTKQVNDLLFLVHDAPIAVSAPTADPNFGVTIVTIEDYLRMSTIVDDESSYELLAARADELQYAWMKAEVLKETGIQRALKSSFGVEAPALLTDATRPSNASTLLSPDGSETDTGSDSSDTSCTHTCEMELFGIGGAGMGLPLHWHGEVSLNLMLSGSKRWVMSKNMPSVGVNHRRSSLHWMTDHLPAARADPDANVVECLLHPGDAMFVPDGWYHSTVNVGPTLNAAFKCGCSDGNGGVEEEELDPDAASTLFFSALQTNDSDVITDVLERGTELYFPRYPNFGFGLAENMWGTAVRELAAIAPTSTGPQQVPFKVFQQVVQLLTKATRVNPLNADYWFGLAQVLGDREEYDGALDAATKALELSPNACQVCSFRAYLLMQKERYHESRLALLDCLDRLHGVLLRRSNDDLARIAIHASTDILEMLRDFTPLAKEAQEYNHVRFQELMKRYKMRVMTATLSASKSGVNLLPNGPSVRLATEEEVMSAGGGEGEVLLDSGKEGEE